MNNIHKCIRCSNPIDLDNTDWCDVCDMSIFDDRMIKPKKMLTIQNFEERLKDYRILNTFDGWTLMTYKPTEAYYEFKMGSKYDDGNKFVTIRLHRNVEMEAGDDREKVYKVEFIDFENGHPVYEHFCTLNWLKKPANNLLMRFGEIINQYVVNHPRFGLGPLPF